MSGENMYIDYKYNEDKAIQAIRDYVDSTYGQHYVGDGDVQTVDFWRSLGSLESTSRDTAIKYLARYGKKGGKNRKDLLKSMHYIILMMYALDLEENQQPKKTLDEIKLDEIKGHGCDLHEIREEYKAERQPLVSAREL